MQRLTLANKIARSAMAPFVIRRDGMSSQPNTSSSKPPMLDMISIHDEAANGFMARVVYKSGRIEFSHYPQLGPRKTDPMDPMPQFDMNAKIFYRPNRGEFSDMLAVTKGKTTEASITTSYGAKIDLKKSAEGFVLNIDSPNNKGKDGEVNRKCELHFNNQYAAALRSFFDFACVKQFGFDKPTEQRESHTEGQARGNYQAHNNDRQRKERPPREEKKEVKIDDLDDW